MTSMQFSDNLFGDQMNQECTLLSNHGINKYVLQECRNLTKEKSTLKVSMQKSNQFILAYPSKSNVEICIDFYVIVC